MIKAESLIKIGNLVKPHGIKGEITATIDYDIDLTLLKAIIISADGIFVPFFVNSERPKSSESIILAIDGCNSDIEAKDLCGHEIYALRDDVVIDDEPDGTGGYVSDFIGYDIYTTDGMHVGRISDFDDSTDNVLFIVDTQDDMTIYVPVAEELIQDINPDTKSITMNLPEGLLELGK